MAPKSKKSSKDHKAEEEPAPSADASWTCNDEDCGYDNEAGDTECASCEKARPAAASAAEGDDNDKFNNFACGRVVSLEEVTDKLTACKIDVGAEEVVTIVTNAGNVAEGTRVVVAKVGAIVPSIGEAPLKKRAVGGVPSEGMLCDGKMLGWKGGGEGAAAQVPDSFSPGDRPPEQRPRMDGKK